jgi:iron(III) transport system ATP-binding protein
MSNIASADLALRVVDLVKQFQREKGGRVNAVDGISLDIERGTMVTVLGPSGCGKTTLLRCIAGLEVPTGGEVWSGDRLLSSGAKGLIIPPERRGFGMMFQSYAVWPHMSVFENVAYSLRIKRRPKEEIERRVSQILDVVGIAHLRNEYSTRLSGGQQQRIALARCLVNDPDVILFDEPLSNVDAKVREELRVELLAMQRRIGFAGVYVTHDQEEAMAISDRIVVMNEGKAVQVGPPREVYRRPTSRFVASFVGVVNLWPGRLGPSNGTLRTVTTDLGPVRVTAANVPVDTAGEGAEVVLMTRPEGLTVHADGDVPEDLSNVWPGTLRAEMFRGAHTDLLVEVGDHIVRARAGDDSQLTVGGAVRVVVAPQRIRVLAGGTNVVDSPDAEANARAIEEALKNAVAGGDGGDPAAADDPAPSPPPASS